MKIRLTFIVLALAGLLAACSDPRKVQLEALGMLGQHDLRRIEQTAGVNGNMSGSFFLGIGSVSGTVASERKLQFYWGRTPDEFISTTMPYSMFRFIIDETKATPTVEFIFDENFLNEGRAKYTESEKSNPNWWLTDDMVRNNQLRVVIIRISRQALEKEVYLPK